jgi:hypothetical protein
MIVYKEFDSSLIESIKDIYKKESWNSYLKDDGGVKGRLKIVNKETFISCAIIELHAKFSDKTVRN